MSFLYARYGKAVIAGEVAVLAGTYYIYHNLTTSAEYRLKMETHMPWFMDAFHQATNGSYRLPSAESPAPPALATPGETKSSSSSSS